MPEPRREIVSTPLQVHGGASGPEAAPTHDFSVNGNPFGPPPELLELLAATECGRYPDPTCGAARRAAADLHHASPGEVVFGNGSSDLIDRLAACYLAPGRRALVAEPTFGEYARASLIHGAEVTGVRPYGPGEEIRLDILVQAVCTVRPTLLWLCHPNNPTGQAWPAPALAGVAAACRDADALMVLDLAYLELSSADAAALPVDAVVLRSPTKSFGIPGVRLGYAVAPAPVAAALERVAPPWQVGAHAQTAARWCLGEAGRSFLAATVSELLLSTDRFRSGLASLGHGPSPGVTSFFLVEVGDAARLCREAADAGFRLRDCSSFGLPRHVRLATRLPVANEALLDWLAVREERRG
jgi:histidinol-phosphate aminotransferase